MTNSIELVILNYNNFKDTKTLVEYLHDNLSSDHGITIVDNNSPDNSFEKLKEQFQNIPRIDLIKSEANGGYAKGNNIALKGLLKKAPEYVVIINNDISIVNPNLFKDLAQFYETLESPAFIAPVHKNSDDSVNIYSARKCPSFTQILLSCFLLFDKYSSFNRYDLTGKEPLKVDILSGAFLFTKFQFFKEIDFFDEGTFLYLEERILFEKVKKKKKWNYVIPSLHYYHDSSSTIKKEFSPLKTYAIYNKSLVYYVDKYLKHGWLKKIILRPFLFLKMAQLYLIKLIR